MKKNIMGILLICMIVIGVTGCGEKTEKNLSKEATDAIAELYAIQENYSNGIAPANIIPVPTVEAIYNNWDDIEEVNAKMAPISLREYVDPSVVYFDYDTDYSVKWIKDTGDVLVEETDVTAREDYKQKMHK